MIRYYTSPNQLALSRSRGRTVEWLECSDCDGDGFYPNPDEPVEPELCSLCLGRGGEWGVRVAQWVLTLCQGG